MRNKYLEKIAKELSEEEIRAHGNSAYRKGLAGSLAGSLVPLPFVSPALNLTGRAHELAKAKTKVMGSSVPMGEVSGEALRSGARSFGRSVLESVAGGVAGGALAGGLTRNPAATQAGAIVGGIAGMLHGGHKSSQNSMRDFHNEWQQEKKDRK